eukprot:4320774-Amphidinium_carterae.1
MSARDKVKFFNQWQLHREDKEPLEWTTAFTSTVSQEHVSTLGCTKTWLNNRQILKHYGMEHLLGEDAGRMLKDILFQQAGKHSYENSCRVSVANNRELDGLLLVLDHGERLSSSSKKTSSWTKLLGRKARVIIF